MNFLKRVTSLVYLVAMIGAGALMLAMSVEVVPSGVFADMVEILRSSLNASIALSVVGTAFILMGVLAPFRVSKSLGRNRLITFRNPDGEVTVALSAIENYVKRVARDIPGINDIKSNVKASKKGINITSYVAICAGTNIPEATENIQMTVKSRVQDMLGVEENINMTMHISKILKEQDENTSASGEDRSSDPPFRELG
jgi:uncharacterized alkaline shock family protein YloU